MLKRRGKSDGVNVHEVYCAPMRAAMASRSRACSTRTRGLLYAHCSAAECIQPAATFRDDKGADEVSRRCQKADDTPIP